MKHHQSAYENRDSTYAPPQHTPHAHTLTRTYINTHTPPLHTHQHAHTHTHTPPTSQQQLRSVCLSYTQHRQRLPLPTDRRQAEDLHVRVICCLSHFSKRSTVTKAMHSTNSDVLSPSSSFIQTYLHLLATSVQLLCNFSATFVQLLATLCNFVQPVE